MTYEWCCCHCTNHLDRNTCKPFYNYILCEHIDLLNQMVLVEHTYVGWPYHNLLKTNKNRNNCDNICFFFNFFCIYSLTITTQCSFTFDNFTTPTRCAWYSCYSRFIFNLCCIKFKWILTTAQCST